MRRISALHRTCTSLALLLAASAGAGAQMLGAAAESGAAPAFLGAAPHSGALSAPLATGASAAAPALSVLAAAAAPSLPPEAAAAAAAVPASAPEARAAEVSAAAAPALTAAARADASPADLAGAGAALERALQDATETVVPRAFPKDSPLAGVSVVEVAPRIYHLQFPTQHLMTGTFLRFQEHYESPKFQGRVFTHKEFAEWYAREFGKDGRFTYLDDWAGFNIPSRILKPFAEGKFGVLKRKEQDFLNLFAGLPHPFYIIGTYGEGAGDVETLRHEIAHGLYSTRREYRREVLSVLRTVRLKPIFEILRKLGYHRRTWIDEAHAYLGDDLADLRKEGLDTAPYEAVHAQLLALYSEHFHAPR